MKALRDLEVTLHRQDLKRSTVVDILWPLPLPALWAFAALTGDPTVRDCLLDYLTKARHERPHLSGDDLLALGIPRGPQLGEILSRLRGAKLDGEIISRQDEETYVQRILGDEAISERASSRSS
jgi:tRNA nucleotidyltransferase (CCA-adding enzyme)